MINPHNDRSNLSLKLQLAVTTFDAIFGKSWNIVMALATYLIIIDMYWNIKMMFAMYRIVISK